MINKTCTTIQANGGCNHCNRSGFAFLPVRYAIAKHGAAKHIALPEGRVKAFTNISLKKLIDENGVITEKNNDAWYILRKLRKGYLYVYDEHPRYPHWLCYAVGENGELTQFPAGKLVLPKKVECDKSINYALAGLVALQDEKTDRTINIIFLEAPFSYERLSWIAQHPEWRAVHMQQVALGSIALSPFCFSDQEIQDYIAEYSKVSPVDLLKDDLEPGRFSSPSENLIYINNDRDSYQGLMSAFNKANSKSKNRYAIAVFDSVGIIKQLNIYRLSALDDFAKNLKPDDEGADKEVRQSSFSMISKITGNNVQKPYYELNERNYKWYLAVNKLKELMAVSLSLKSKEYGELLPPGVPENYVLDDDFYVGPGAKSREFFKGKKYSDFLEYYNSIYNNYNKDADDYIRDHNITSGSEAQSVRNTYNQMAFYEQYQASTVKEQYYSYWKSENEQSKQNIKKSEEEILNDYIEQDDWCNIKKLFDEKYNSAKNISVSFDSDYAIWIDKMLHFDLDKYDQNDPIQSGAVVAIIADVLENGILSGASKYLWKNIISNDNSLIDRGFSINNNVLYDDIKKSISSFRKKDDKKKIFTPSGELNKELVGKIEKNAAKIRDFLSKVKAGEMSEVFKLKTAPLVSTLNSLSKLHNTSINTASCLVIEDIKNEINKGLIKANTLSVGFRYSNRMVEIHNFGNTINKAFYGNGFNSYVTVEVNMTASQANNYVNSLNNCLEKDNINIKNKNVAIYENGEKVGGNYQFNEREGNSNVVMYVFVKENAADKIRNSLKVRGVDALNKDVKELYQNQQKNVSKINMPSAAVIKLGCVYSLMSAFNTYRDKKDFSSLWKLISSTLAVIQNASEAASWILTKKAEKLLEKSILADTEAVSEKLILNSSKIIVKSEGVMVFSKLSGHAVSLMAIYDAVKGVLEAIDIYNSGGLSEDYRNKAISTAAGFISSVVIGLFISNIFIGAIAAVVSIAILFCFDVNRVVPECIQHWLRRSKFGRQSDTVPGLSFENMKVEQESLSMLFKGIVFTVLIENKDIEYFPKYHERNRVSHVISETKVVSIKFSLPENFDGSLSVSGLKNNLGEDIERVYLVDNDKKVCKLVFSNYGEGISGKEAASSNVIDNKRVSSHGDLISYRDGEDLTFIINSRKVLRMESMGGDHHEVSDKEEFSFNKNKLGMDLDLKVVVKTGGESFSQNYHIKMKLGDDRKR